MAEDTPSTVVRQLFPEFHRIAQENELVFEENNEYEDEITFTYSPRTKTIVFNAFGPILGKNFAKKVNHIIYNYSSFFHVVRKNSTLEDPDFGLTLEFKEEAFLKCHKDIFLNNVSNMVKRFLKSYMHDQYTDSSTMLEFLDMPKWKYTDAYLAVEQFCLLLESLKGKNENKKNEKVFTNNRHISYPSTENKLPKNRLPKPSASMCSNEDLILERLSFDPRMIDEFNRVLDTIITLLKEAKNDLIYWNVVISAACSYFSTPYYDPKDPLQKIFCEAFGENMDLINILNSAKTVICDDLLGFDGGAKNLTDDEKNRLKQLEVKICEPLIELIAQENVLNDSNVRDIFINIDNLKPKDRLSFRT